MSKLLIGITIGLFIGLSGYLNFIGYFEKTNKAPESTNIKSVARKKDTCLVTYVLIVNLPDGKYNKKYFRKSLAYSIDREQLFEISPGDYSIDKYGDKLPGGPAIYGIVQPVFPEYDIKTINGYVLNIDSAKYYLKKSKYNLNDPLVFYSGSFGPYSITPTATMQKFWYDQLGLTKIHLNVLSSSTLFSKVYSEEKGIYIIPLINQYKEPEKYLSIFYSKKTLSNSDSITMKHVYTSPAFDALYEAGLNASTRSDAITNFKAAEQVLIDDAVVIPLWYGKYLYD